MALFSLWFRFFLDNFRYRRETLDAVSYNNFTSCVKKQTKFVKKDVPTYDVTSFHFWSKTGISLKELGTFIITR